MMNEVMSPEDYQALLQLGQQNQMDEASIQQMLAQAEQLRAMGQAPQMRNAGRYQMAAHPLEFLGALANQNVANQKSDKATAMRKVQGDRTGQQNQMVLASLLRQQQPAQQPQNAWTPAGTDEQGFGTFPVR